MITHGWRSVPTCRECGTDRRIHPAECPDPLTDAQAFWSPRKVKEVSMGDPTEDLVKDLAKDEPEKTDNLIKDVKDGK